jgi:hypothetical protein
MLGVIGKVSYYLVPNLERMNFRPMAAYNISVPLKTFAANMGYGLAYGGVACALAIIVFSKRDFR